MNKIIKENLKNIFLCTSNPRVSNEINFDSITGDSIRKSHKNDDENIMQDILALEGDMSNLVELFRSIKEGYNPLLDMPYIIESKEENQFIVVEGNRRIMVLKCLNSLLEFPTEWDSKKMSLADDETIIETEIDNENTQDITNDEKKIKANIKTIHNLINEYKKDKTKTDYSISVNKISKSENEDEEISIAIFSNHVTGNKIGKRNWNRGKTLDLYLNFWKTVVGKDDEEKIRKISRKLNRTPAVVKQNLHSASFIEYLINKAKRDKKDFFRKNKVSTLEMQFVKKLIDFKKKNRWKNEIEYKPNLNFEKIILESKNNKFSPEQFATFVIESLEKKHFNTRVIKEEAHTGLSILFGESEDFKKEDFHKTFTELANKNIELLIKEKHKTTPEMHNFLSFAEESKSFADKITFKIDYKNHLTENPPLQNTFNNLFQQYKTLLLNGNNKKLVDFPFNGIMSTLRCLLENLSYFLMSSKELFEDFKESKEFKKMKIKEIEKTYLNIYFSNNSHNFRLYHTYNYIRNKISENTNVNPKIIEALQVILNNKSINNISDLTTILSQETFEYSSKIIHAPHLLFLEEDNNQILLNDFQTHLTLLKNTFELFKELKIISYEVEKTEKKQDFKKTNKSIS